VLVCSIFNLYADNRWGSFEKTRKTTVGAILVDSHADVVQVDSRLACVRCDVKSPPVTYK